jgi:hypothetical protein
MSFVAFGMMEILLLLGSSHTSPTHDLVSLLRAEDYFQSRNIALEAAGLVKLAATEPADGKAQIQQLLALRWLGENAAKVAKTPEARVVLEQIAAGKKAQDANGFAKLYARQALARLDRKPLPVAVIAPAAGLQAEAFTGFPADINCVAGMELWSRHATVAAASDPIRDLIAATIPRRERESFYQGAEALGNLRLDRVTLGVAVNDDGSAHHIVVSFRGTADGKRIADFLARQMPGVVKRQEKGPRGESIRVLDGSTRDGSALAFIGDRELIACSAPEKSVAGTVLAQVLEVRAGKQKGLIESKLGRLTKETPRNARALIAYDLPEKAVGRMSREFQPLPALPGSLLAYVTSGDPSDATKTGKLSIAFSGRMKDADQAKAFADAAGKLKQQGLKALDNVPPQEKVPPAVIKVAKDTLSSLNVEASSDSVKGGLTIGNEAALFEALKLIMMAREAPPPRPEKLPDKPPPPRSR